MLQRLVLPVPPSSNRYWRHNRGQIHVSSEAKAYRSEVALLAAQGHVTQLAGDVVIRLTWFRKAKRGDLDNRLKQVLDAIQGHLYADDSQIAEIRFRREDDKKNPRLVVWIAEDGTLEAQRLLGNDITVE
jgi:crossover junction endodeoxyribonuclease RusA